MARLRISSTAESRVRTAFGRSGSHQAWEGMAPTPNHEASIGIYPAIAPTRLVVSDIAGVASIFGTQVYLPRCPVARIYSISPNTRWADSMLIVTLSSWEFPRVSQSVIRKGGLIGGILTATDIARGVEHDHCPRAS